MKAKEPEIESKELETQIGRAQELLVKVREEVAGVIVGQQAMIDGILMGMLANGHVLLEGVPGLAKTLAVKTLSDVIDAGFKRIQFTPDLLPADIVGTMVYRQQTGEFIARKGPVFSNIILADEINRAPAKVQSALLESMEERQVTIGENTYPLPDPFFVLATQNPIEHEGTYPLPEAQLDRFVMKLKVVYPSAEEELAILRRVGVERTIEVRRLLYKPDLKRLRDTAAQISVDPRIEEYMVAIAGASRERSPGSRPLARYIEYGASPRATIHLYRCSKIRAFFEGRGYVVPEDVKAVAPDVLRHRMVLSYEAETDEMSPDDVIDSLLASVTVP